MGATIWRCHFAALYKFGTKWGKYPMKNSKWTRDGDWLTLEETILYLKLPGHTSEKGYAYIFEMLSGYEVIWIPKQKYT